MKVLLVQPPHYGRPPEYFPLGLGYLASVLKSQGHYVNILDAWANKDFLYNNEQYDVIGISALTTQYRWVKLHSPFFKYHAKLLVLGNTLATFNSNLIFKNTEVDTCVKGEGEQAFPQLLTQIIPNMKGTTFEREYVKDLDSIPFPDWLAFPTLQTYMRNCRVQYLPAFNVITSRGCPYSCRFCSKLFKQARYRSVNNVMLEIKTLKQLYKLHSHQNLKAVYFGDELFLANKNRAYEFCERLKAEGLKWQCNGRVNLVDPELLKTMKRSGCVMVAYGVESGSQTILDSMNKNVTVQQSHDAIQATLDAGIRPQIQMMYGYVGENKETLQETIEFFKRLPYVGRIQFFPTTPLSGSQLYEDCLHNGLIKNEEEYLLSLQGGYGSNRKPQLINLTEFSNEEYWTRKEQFEQAIWKLERQKYKLGDFARDVWKGARKLWHGKLGL